MRVLGIDPGLDGATAMVDGGTLTFVQHNLALDGKTRGRELNLPHMWGGIGWAGDMDTSMVYIERVQALPKQGASSGFKFGKTAGYAEAFVVAAGLPWQHVEPREWMAEFNLKGGNKDQNVATALRLFPYAVDEFTVQRKYLTKVQVQGRADAALIALWGFRHLVRGGNRG